jgi:hypothetical protein
MDGEPALAYGWPGTALGVSSAARLIYDRDAAVRHVASLARMIKNLSGNENTLTKWIGAVDADLPALRSLTGGLRRDLAAVVAGLTTGYNSGAVEGTVNRIKRRDVRPRQTRPAPQTDTARMRTASTRDIVPPAVESAARAASASASPAVSSATESGSEPAIQHQSATLFGTLYGASRSIPPPTVSYSVVRR